MTTYQFDRLPSRTHVFTAVFVAIGLMLITAQFFGTEGGKDSMKNSEYFSPDYSTARTRFRKAVDQAGGRLDILKLDAEGPDGGDLTIDIAWFGAETPRRVLVHTSGLHGVEGFAGSAIQLQFLEEMPTIPEGDAIVLVHILNPYGMVWLRRFNENSVDLNRNFLMADESYEGTPEAYPQLDAFLNPPNPPSRDLFSLRAAWLIVRHGMPALKEAIVTGQYEYPSGLFFGGKRLEQGARLYLDWVRTHLSTSDRIMALDVHTGLGESGEDTLLVDEKMYERARSLFGERVAPFDADQGVAYEIRGGFHTMIPKVLSDAQVDFVGQEFGTYGPTHVLHALREENRWHHYGGGEIDHPAKQHLKDTFFQNEEPWRTKVLTRGRELLGQAVRLAFQT